MKQKKVFLTIGGSDPCGGAGIQADVKTAIRLGFYPCSVITAITAQNSSEVTGIWPVPADQIRAELNSVLEDLRPDAVKIGLLASREAVVAVAEVLESHQLQNLVLDPVIRPTLLPGKEDKDLVRDILELLFPIVTIATPNIREKEILERIAGMPLQSLCEALLVTGGDAEGKDSVDTLFFHNFNSADHLPSTAFPSINFNHSSTFDHSGILPLPPEEDGIVACKEFRNKRIDTRNTHGSGCILSSAIACHLAKNPDIQSAVRHAIDFTHEALKEAAGYRLTNGNYGPALI